MLLVGFVVLGPAWFVLLTPPCLLLLHLVSRRCWLPATYNSAAVAVSGGAALGLTHLLGAGLLSALVPRDLGALVLAALLFRGLLQAAAAAAVRADGGAPAGPPEPRPSRAHAGH